MGLLGEGLGMLGKGAKSLLDMSTSARMQRADDMGLDADKDWYHGTADDIEGFLKSKRGSGTQSNSAKKAFWFTDDAETTAKSYADHSGTTNKVAALLKEADVAERAGNWDLYDEKLRAAEELESFFMGVPANRLQGQNIIPTKLPKEESLFVVDMKGESFEDGAFGGVNEALDHAKAAGYKGVKFLNLDDAVGFSDKSATHVAIFEPKNIRSKFAKFDPANADSSSLLASNPVATAAAGAGGILAMSASDDSEAGLLGKVRQLVAAGYPESTAKKIASGELPMDYASRMSRAADQGFTEEMYHAGKYGGRGDTLAEQGILNIDPPRKTGMFLSGDPEVAASYTGRGNEDAATYPMLVNTRGMEKVNAEGEHWNNIFDPEVIDPEGKQVMEILDGIDGEYSQAIHKDDYTNTNALAVGAKERMATGTVIDNVIDVGPNQRMFNKVVKDNNPQEYPHEWIQDYERRGGKVIALQDGTQARAKLGAAFDPDNINSTNILGSNPAAFLGAGILGLGGMASSDDSHASNVPLDQLYSPSSLNKAKGILGDVGSIQAPISGNVSKLGSMMGDFNRNISDDALLGMIAPELPAELVNKMAYGDKRGLLDYIRAGLGLI